MYKFVVWTYCIAYAFQGLNALMELPFHQIAAALIYFLLAVLAYRLYSAHP